MKPDNGRDTNGDGQLLQRLIRVEMQLERYSSDLESEKRTRARVNADMEARLRKVEAANWKAAGVIACIVVLAQYLIPKMIQ